MDSLSHLVLGASAGYLVFHQQLGRRAAAVAGLAAISPDIDIFVRSASDPLLAIELHRGFTHGLAFAPIGAAVVASVWRWWPGRGVRPPWSLLWLCSLVGYVTHPLLDAATSYGTRLWWPFSDVREGWDLISIIDPLFTIALLAGIIIALVRRQPRVAAIALALGSGYLALGAWQHARALTVAEQLAARRGHRIERLEAMPSMANNIVWRTLYEHGGRLYADRVRVGWFTAPTVREGWSLPVVSHDELSPAERARNARRSFERFQWFSDGWVARSPADASFLADMRYSLSSEAFDPIWGIRFTPTGSVAEVEWVNRTRDRQVGLRNLWSEVAGDDPRFKPL